MHARELRGTLLISPSVSIVRLGEASFGVAARQPSAKNAPKESTPAAVVTIGAEARAKAAASAKPEAGEAPGAKTDARAASGAPELSESEQQQVRELKNRDREVRSHEQAHKSAGGAYAGSIHYDYQRGPDHKRYAVGGHVPIDVSEVSGDPGATIRKMDIVRQAALAPAEPSSADRQVAATASKKAAQARAELAQSKYAEADAAVPGARAAREPPRAAVSAQA